MKTTKTKTKRTADAARWNRIAEELNDFNVTAGECLAVADALMQKQEIKRTTDRDRSIIFGLAAILVEKLDVLCERGRPLHDEAEQIARVVRR